MQIANAVSELKVIPRPPLRPPPDAGLRRELDALNLELKVMRSTDHSLRAYVSTWLTLVFGSVAGKLLLDWHRIEAARFPTVAVPVAVLALAFLADATVHRLHRRRLVAGENVQLARQRELRTLLGIDEAPVPKMSPLLA